MGGGTFLADAGTASTLSGAITGVGAWTKAGPGTLTLTGANTYSGGTTVSAGTLQLGAGGTTGSITGNVANNGILAFNRSDVVTFGGVISGTGSVQQNGTGTTVLIGTTPTPEGRSSMQERSSSVTEERQEASLEMSSTTGSWHSIGATLSPLMD